MSATSCTESNDGRSDTAVEKSVIHGWNPGMMMNRTKTGRRQCSAAAAHALIDHAFADSASFRAT